MCPAVADMAGTLVSEAIWECVYITGHAKQGALTATGKAGCAAGDSVDRCSVYWYG